MDLISKVCQELVDMCGLTKTDQVVKTCSKVTQNDADLGVNAMAAQQFNAALGFPTDCPTIDKSSANTGSSAGSPG
jgi:hypothetical protein